MRLRSIWFALVLVAAAALVAGPALAVSFSYDFTTTDYNSSDFSLVGSAAWVSDGGLPAPPDRPGPAERLRLTSNGAGQQGSAWQNQGNVDASQAWTADFDWQITFEAGGGADGLAFHLQEDGLAANASFEGGGLSNPRLSVGIDTWDNGGGNGDGNDFHLQVFQDGAQVGPLVPLGGLSGAFGAVDHVWRAFLSYDGAGTLTINVFDANFGNQTFPQNFAVDLSALDQATFGFSANTGGSAENHDIRALNANFAVPEPGTLMLLGLGLMGLAHQGRRRA